MGETPKDVVVGFFADLNGGKYTEAYERVAPDVDFWIAGREWSIGGRYDRKGVQAVLAEKVAPALAAPIVAEIVGITAEGKRVAVEVEAGGPTTSGAMYQNQFHFLFVVDDGKIVEAREYHDTLHASRVIGA
ncbi:nuclear transport factor 2 family protein [Streptomyces odonnellii]|uniref:nuclear transport factor 2 family protein n=1 Tax=Streptomyces odonnellii TaxID=1417980 RepID=UPI0006267A79|nr:nuclear transport factor 2 family protein [Streptomyces odonnellii]